VLIIKIPVKPFVKKFLEFNLPEGPIKLSKKGHLTSMLYALLQSERKESKFDSYLAQYTAHVEVELSINQRWHRGCRNLASIVIHDFNQLMEEKIEEKFLEYVDTSIEAVRSIGGKIKVKEAIGAFMGKYCLDECDIEYETLYKKYYRYLKDKNLLPSYVFAVRNCPIPKKTLALPINTELPELRFTFTAGQTFNFKAITPHVSK
jgi:hypothetical protein